MFGNASPIVIGQNFWFYEGLGFALQIAYLLGHNRKYSWTKAIFSITQSSGNDFHDKTIYLTISVQPTNTLSFSVFDD